MGGLPLSLVPLEQARRVVEEVERRLWTPCGLRTLAPDEPGYQPLYRGDAMERNNAYHQGSAWPWLAGPFVEAWLKTKGVEPVWKADARERFLNPLKERLRQSGSGHLAELFDGEEPYRPGGCPFQAWSMGELIRLEKILTV